MENYDFITIFFDTIHKCKSKKLILEVLGKMKIDVCENKTKFFFTNLYKLAKNDLEILLQIDENIILYVLRKIKIKQSFVDDVIKLIELTKIKIEYKISEDDHVFFQNNFYNYYVYKKISQNYIFDILFEESSINNDNIISILNLYVQMAKFCYNDQKFKDYISNMKIDGFQDSFYNLLYKEDQSAFQKFSSTINNSPRAINLCKDIQLKHLNMQNTEHIQLDPEIMNFTAQNINEANILKFYKNFLCYNKSVNGICAVCGSLNATNHGTYPYKIDEMLSTNVFLLNSTNDIKSVFLHNDALTNIDNLENVIKASFKMKEIEIIKLFSLFDFFENTEFCKLIIDLIDFISNKSDKSNITIMFNIIKYIKNPTKIFHSVFKYLYNIYCSTNNKFLKIQIQMYMKSNYNLLRIYNTDLYDFLFKNDFNHANLHAVLQTTTELFDVQYDELVLNILQPIALYTFENNCFHFLNDDKIRSMAQSFVLFDSIIKQNFCDDIYFGLSNYDVSKKFSTKLLTLAFFYKLDLKKIIDFLNISDISAFIHKNFVPMILLVKDIFLVYRIDYECCIYEVLEKILELLGYKNNCFNVKASSYIMYFVTEKTDIVKEWCETLKHKLDVCKNNLFEILSNSFRNTTYITAKNQKKRVTNIKSDLVDDWYINALIHLQAEDKLYFFTIHKTSAEFENFLEKMNNNIFIDDTFLKLFKNNTNGFKNKFTIFYAKFYQKYSRFKESYSFIGRWGISALYNHLEIEKVNFVFDNKISVSHILTGCLEYIYKAFNIEEQETYYYIMQQMLKGVSDNKMLRNIDEDFVQHIKTSAYVYDGDFDVIKRDEPQFSNIYYSFVSDFFNYIISLLKNNNLQEYFDYFKYAKLLDHKSQSFILKYMLFVLCHSEIEINVQNIINQNNLQKINRRSLSLLLNLDSFCLNRLMDQSLSINIALYLKDYYYLLKKYENKHRRGDNVRNILCALYILMLEYEKCKVLNMQTNIMSPINVFFTLCLDNDFASAKLCLKNIHCEEVESNLFNQILEKHEINENDIEEIYKLSDDLAKQYSKWFAMETDKKTTNIHIAYDIKLMLKRENGYDLVKKRHEQSAFRDLITKKHLNLIDFLDQKKNNAGFEKNNLFDNFKTHFLLENISAMRKSNKLDHCKTEIKTLLLNNNDDVLYEYSKYKLQEGQTNEAIQILKKYLFLKDEGSLFYKKSTILYAKLSQNQEIFTSAIDKYKNSETLLFQYAKFQETIDPLSSLEAYLKSLTFGTKHINESLLKIINLLCEVRDEKYKKKSYKTLAEYYNKASVLADTYFKIINVNDYKYFIGQILSKLGHPNKKINDIIATLIKNIINSDNFSVSGWYIMFTFDKEAKDLHTEMINILKILPSEMHQKLKEFNSLLEALINISKYNAKGSKNFSIDEKLKLNRSVNIDMRMPNEGWDTNIQEIDDTIYVYHSLQCPKRIMFKGCNGKNYYFLCKSNDDLRKDARFMDLSRVMNFILNNDKSVCNMNIYIRTYNIFVLRYSCGIIEWVGGLETLRNIIYPEYEKLGLNVNDELKKHRSKQKIGDKNFENVLGKFPPVLYNHFDSIIDPKTSYMARERFTKTYAVMCIVGWFMGLGDRHLENIMIDTSTSDTFHVDLNCILNKAQKLEIPESVPFRLTQNIVDAFGVLKTEATFKTTMVKTLKSMINNKELIMTTLQCIINDPFSEWKAKSKISTENINKVLNSFRAKFDCEPDKMVEHLIKEAKDLHNLANMYIGWCSFI